MTPEAFARPTGRRRDTLEPGIRSGHLITVLLSSLAVLLGSISVQAQELHPETFVGTIVSRTGSEVGLTTMKGVEFGREEELWVYQKRDAIQIGGVTVKVNWTRIGKIRLVSSEDGLAEAVIVQEYSDSAIAVGDEIGRLPNTSPKIVAFIIDSSEVRPRHEIGIHVKAEDDEGDALRYSAEASGGTLLHLSDRSPILQWVAPQQPGTYEITVRVSDDKDGVADGKAVIQVLPISETEPYRLVSAIGGDSGRAPWQFGEVADIGVDERDNMWVLDAKNNLLRIVAPTGVELGTIDLTHGKSAAGITPAKILLGKDGSVHVLDISHQSLQTLDRKGNLVRTVFDSANRKALLIEAPSDMETTENGDVLVTDSAGGHVVVLDTKGAFVLLFAAQGTGRGQLVNPVSITTNNYGDLYVLDSGKEEILEFDRMFRFRASYACPLEGGAGGILADTGDNSILVLDYTAGSVRKLDADGTLRAYVAPVAGVDSGRAVATSMARRSDGCILMGTENASIWEFDAAGALRGILGEERFGEVSSIAVTDDGRLLVLDRTAAQVKRFDRHRWLRGRFGEKGQYEGQFQNPVRIGVDGEGNSYVFDSGRNCLQRFSATGVFDKLLPVGEDVAGNLKDATDIAITRDGTIYILDARRKAVFILSREGELEKIAPLSASGARENKQIKRPEHVAVDEQGNIYVSDPPAYLLHKLDAEGKRMQSLGGKGKEPGQFGKIVDLAADRHGFVYVLVKDRCAVAMFNSDGRFVMEIPLIIAEDTSLKSPELLAVDSFGALYIYDSYYKAAFKFMQ
jgi:DNA-binding beta-propeller fold protein YncE